MAKYLTNQWSDIRETQVAKKIWAWEIHGRQQIDMTHLAKQTGTSMEAVPADQGIIYLIVRDRL